VGAVSVGEQEWWAALLGYDDSFTLEDLLPGSEGTEVWDQLDAEEQRRQLLALVAELPKPQRQALLLHALEDYDPAEIAMVQDRPESQVKADIEAARKTLKERLVAGGQAGEASQPTIAAATKGD
jgi:RNA polymerase sigma factor (sigma-70 family)